MLHYLTVVGLSIGTVDGWDDGTILGTYDGRIDVAVDSAKTLKSIICGRK